MSATSVGVAPSGERLWSKGRHGVIHVWCMSSDRFVSMTAKTAVYLILFVSFPVTHQRVTVNHAYSEISALHSCRNNSGDFNNNQTTNCSSSSSTAVNKWRTVLTATRPQCTGQWVLDCVASNDWPSQPINTSSPADCSRQSLVLHLTTLTAPCLRGTTYLSKMKTSRDLDHDHLRDSLSPRDRHFWANPCTKFDGAIFRHCRET